MLNKKIVAAFITALAMLAGVVLLTKPQNSPLLLLAVPPLLLGVLVGTGSSILLKLLLSKDMATYTWVGVFAGALGIAATLLVVMSSLRQLTVTSTLLLVTFVLVFMFYLSKFKK